MSTTLPASKITLNIKDDKIVSVDSNIWNNFIINENITQCIGVDVSNINDFVININNTDNSINTMVLNNRASFQLEITDDSPITQQKINITNNCFSLLTYGNQKIYFY